LIFEASSNKFIVNPGSIIKLGNNAEIIIKSGIDAQGTAADPITFTALYPPHSPDEYWKWLKLDGSQDTDPPPERIFDYVTIEYADYGIHATQVSDLTVINSIIQNCEQNIYLNNSYAYLDNNIIAYAETEAINANGVYLYNSSPVFYNNTIRDNTLAGVFCNYYSSPNFGSPSASVPGNNVLIQNYYGIFASNYSNPFLGEVIIGESGPFTLAGFNSIYDNEGFAVSAQQNCDIMAHKNWWGGYPVDPRIFDIDEDDSSIDYSNALTFDPNQESSALTGGGSISERPGYSPMPTENFTPRQLLRLAKKLRVQRLPRPALPVYKQLILNYPNKVEARWGLIELVSTFKEAGRDSAVAYLLNTIAAHPNLKMKRVALDMLTGEYLEKKNANAAVANAQQIVANYPNTESEKTALFDLVNIYFHNLNDPAQAQTYLSQLESKYPNDELTFHAQMLLGSGSGLLAKNQPAGQGNLARKTTNSSDGLSKTGIEEELPETFMLFQNYPNPFNPETTIQFGLPEKSKVQITVYNIAGEQVATLVNGEMAEGHHQVSFDASRLASGIYLYRIQAGEFTQVRKMMLLK